MTKSENDLDFWDWGIDVLDLQKRLDVCKENIGGISSIVEVEAEEDKNA